MRLKTFALRNTREILRDPLNLAFGLGFPVVLLLMLTAIQANIPVSLFEIEHLAPGISAFSLAFITLFSATLIARDRSSSLLRRLYTTPMTATEFVLGYTLPLLPIALAQSAVCYALAVVLGLPLTANLLWALVASLPVALLYIGLGLMCGSVLTDKQVGGICGALLTNVSAWLSGIWFDLELVGGWFQRIAHILPFVHGVELQRAALSGNVDGVLTHLPWVLVYGVLTLLVATVLFLHQMKKQ